jgi:FSR family fosmidomycin resistance protein-like MFS transporter
MASVGLAPTFMVLLALLLMGGFGVAMFHPQAASLAGGGGADRGMAMSFWITGGTLGWALGPTFATVFVSAFGLEHTWLAAIPGLALSALLVSWFVREAPHAPPHAKEHAPLSGLRPVLRPLLLLYGAVVCRSAVSTGFATFLPLWVHANGGSVAMGGLITTLYLTLGALGGFAGGLLAGRFGAHRVVRGSFLVAIPLYAVFFLLAGSHPKWALLPLVLGYAGLQSSLPVNVVLGQQLSPRHAGIISSLLMGAAWGVGSLLTYPVGALADHSGLLVGLLALSGLLLLGLACASSLPSAPARDAA